VKNVKDATLENVKINGRIIDSFVSLTGFT